MFPQFVEDQENQVWPLERRVEVCDRHGLAGEIWGVTYVEPTEEEVS
jgi:hypothetical protein